VLCNTDAVAHITTLLLVASSTTRLQEHLAQNVTNLHFGPRHPLFSYWTTAGLYVVSSMFLLALLVCRSQTYFKYRLKICLAMRCLRLYVQAATLMTPSAAFHIASAVVSRVSKNPQRAPAMFVIQPMAFGLQPALLLLPWQYVVPIQLLSAFTFLYYMWLFPCFLTEVQPDPSTYMWQGRAEVSCSRLQSYSAMVGTALGGSLLDYSSTVCEGMPAVQVLQVFGTLLYLFFVPVTVMFEMERWLRSRCHQGPSQFESVGGSSSSSSQRNGNGAAAVNGGSSSSSNGAVGGAGSSGNSSAHNARASSTSQRGASGTRDFLLSMAESGAEAGGAWGHVLLLLLLAVLVLPITWLLSELLVAVFESSRDCFGVMVLAAAR
jgi:hypothetical protein